MTPERLHRIRAVYEAAVGTPVAARQLLLKRECQGDDDLRQEVERLLGAREHLPEWLSGPLLDVPNRALLEVRPTVTHPAPAGHVHFPPGTMLAQRCRVVHFLGRGGMGEVYRADDLLLGQSVALKFLPAASNASASLLSRFRNEVRTARQVSHPNVCRVYDIGEAEGLTYLSMEYVDGEDLASLLRRIGRLPQEKGLEIARQLCAGLAAAHDKGVIHRDLKPGNIMLDGRGHVRITDFGIAGMGEQIRDVRSGTPAYMSPEQLGGKEVTPRSDIYALGIVLCELFTGKRPPLEAGNTDIDPVVERVIRRCLDPDPRMRPGSALSVSAALPGGDPLAAALARGETPAPEVVANAGSVEGLRPVLAIGCLAMVIVGLGLLCILRQRYDLINQIPMENSSEVLAAKARETAKSFGYTDRPADTLFAWNYDTDYLLYASQQQSRGNGSQSLTPCPPAVYFWYRLSSHYPITSDINFETYLFNRDMLEPGMQAVVLDSEGRLLEFHARPPAQSNAGNQGRAFDWSQLFAAAGLDSARFKAVPPWLTPTAAFDARAAWTGSAEGNDNLRVEAAALLAWRNARSGRGDRRGAFRLAGSLFLFTLLDNLAAMHHVPTGAELPLLFAAMRYAVTLGCFGWLLYMAFEPQVRKRSPVSLISWNRLLAGRLRDPMVAGHLLMGVALGVLASSATYLLPALPFLGGLAPPLPWSNAMLFALWCWIPILAVSGIHSFSTYCQYQSAAGG
jgi:serine/threonine-protein kinase